MSLDPEFDAFAVVATALRTVADLANEPVDQSRSGELDSGGLGSGGLDAVLGRAARLAGARHASVSVVGVGRPRTVGASDAVALALDAAQYASGAGPCLDAARHDRTVVVDVTTDPRWPAWRQQVVTTSSVRHVVSHSMAPLSMGRPAGGSLNLYCEQVVDAGSAGVAAAVDLCRAATAVRTLQDQAANLAVALTSSRAIGAAAGVLMAQRGLTYDVAFELLREASQRTHRKLRDVAEGIVLTGQLD